MASTRSDSTFPRGAATIERWTRRSNTSFALRARIMLACAEFTSPEALEAVLHDHIAAFNADPKPFVLIKSGDDILASVARFYQRTSHSHH